MTSGFRSMKRCMIAPASTAKKKGANTKQIISFRLLFHWRGSYDRIGGGLAYAVEVTG